jgi:hypothetical protein
VCTWLWGSSPRGYSFRPSVGASGGLLIMWDSEDVEIDLSFSFDHVLAVSGRLLKSNEDFILFNVYAPCDVGSQHMLWGNLSSRLANFVGQNVCVCGNFNVVWGVEERRSVDYVPCLAGASYFNRFIANNVLVDHPLIGGQFTWYRGDGHSMSRLGGLLLSENWCLQWPNYLQLGQLCGLSDHCVIVLSVDEQKCGPRPFRMLKCWANVPTYKNFVSSKWQSFQVEGWGGYVVKEKLKRIKVTLWEWHQNHTHNILGKILNVRDCISMLDDKEEISSLGEEEVEELHSLSVELHSLSRIHSSICWQQTFFISDTVQYLLVAISFELVTGRGF